MRRRRGIRNRGRRFAGAQQGHVTAVRTLLPGVIDQIDEAYSNPDSLRGLPTGFTDFDKMTGGLRPGDLVIVAGRPSMGKRLWQSTWRSTPRLRAATKRASVAIFSMEMALRAGDYPHAVLHWRRAPAEPARRQDYR